ncbi:hypothetical protein [Brachybacterium avium]|nr:hypothetical protein [Brachybacterium avium]
MSTQFSFFPGEYLVDTGDPTLDTRMPQTQVDVEGSGVIYFRVQTPRPDPSTTIVTSMNTDLWWIEPEISTDHRLVLLTVLSPSWYIGRGRVRTRLEHLDASGQDRDRGVGERWRVHIDPSSLDGPPVRPEDSLDGPPPHEGTFRNGEVEVDIDYGDDDRVLGFELTIAPPPDLHDHL